MAKKVTIRVIRTFHVEVTPEYGDTDASLREKGLAELKKTARPDDEMVVVLPEGADR